MAEGDTGLARRVAADVGDVASRNDVPWLRGTAQRCQGLAENDAHALVADGLTNPQIGERLFVSRRTVQTHLAHVFAKLDLTSRAQLAAEVTRRRGGPVSGPISARWPTSLARRGPMMRTWLPRYRATRPAAPPSEPREEP